ncbi:hypothetical protein DYB32_009270 [Aphanomyces invadans]|uniref:Myb-like domain-containing protein n=1 Tax=Aphanomyces invadans TaxID=157072 RepID=A0A418AJ21_9STRA|nr:hypothetical protein DYB32_009270 [Aphanomyces invadans]
MSTPIKSRFTDEEDILLLREINARLPFMAKRGQVMQGWTGVADAVQSLDDFDRPGFDGKRTQNRFTLLLETHRHKDEASQRESGSSEVYGEKLQLLDELTSAFDDWKNAEKARLDEVQREADRVDAMAATIREEAMQSLGKRKRTGQEDAEAGSGSGSAISKLMKMMHDDNKADLEFRMRVYESDLKQREIFCEREFEERRCERELRAEHLRFQHEQLRVQHETKMKLLSTLSKSQ